MLVIKVASGNSPEIQNAIEKLTECTPEHKVIDASQMDIQPCRGCCKCMLDTPGVCCIRDDNETLLRAYLQYDDIVFIADTALHYIDYKAKNIIDRIFPLVNVLTRFHEGEILHLPRYDTTFRVALLYTGSADRDLLNLWMIRFQKNMSARSIGAYPMCEVEEVCQWIS